MTQRASADLIVHEACSITGRGIAVFFVKDPDPWLPWRAHRVRVTTPTGHTFEAKANVELARKVPPGEVMVLLFPKLNASDFPAGSRITVLGVADE
jgi:hypothetical protein